MAQSPFRFSLRVLFAITTLAAVVAACFAWNEFAGIWAYLGCLTLVLGVVRGRAACQRIDAVRADGGPPDSPPLVVFAGCIVALAGAIAFCVICSVVQVPFATFVLYPTSKDAEALFQRGLLISIPFGTAALAIIYLLTWPRAYRRIPPVQRSDDRLV